MDLQFLEARKRIRNDSVFHLRKHSSSWWFCCFSWLTNLERDWRRGPGQLKFSILCSLAVLISWKILLFNFSSILSLQSLYYIHVLGKEILTSTWSFKRLYTTIWLILLKFRLRNVLWSHYASFVKSKKSVRILRTSWTMSSCFTPVKNLFSSYHICTSRVHLEHSGSRCTRTAILCARIEAFSKAAVVVYFFDKFLWLAISLYRLNFLTLFFLIELRNAIFTSVLRVEILRRTCRIH